MHNLQTLSNLSEIISGKNNPTIRTLARIASALGITLSELFHDSGIDSWVREKGGHYIAKTPKPRLAKKVTAKKR